MDFIEINDKIRKGQKDIWNAEMVKGATFSKNDIPLCPTTATKLPTRIITWEEAKAIYKKKTLDSPLILPTMHSFAGIWMIINLIVKEEFGNLIKLQQKSSVILQALLHQIFQHVWIFQCLSNFITPIECVLLDIGFQNKEFL